MQITTKTILKAAVFLACFAILTVGCGGDDAAQQDGRVELLTEQDKLDYSIGYTIGSQIIGSLKQGGIEVNSAIFAQAIKDVMDSTAVMTEEEVESRVMAFQQEQQAKQEEAKVENLEAANKLYNENLTEPGIVTLPDSLQYEVLVEGDGAIPKSTDTIKAHYHGTLLDGTVFDSSYDRGEPIEFNPNQVIKGWSEALTMMKTGAKWRLYIPPHLAYGEMGRPNIPPNSMLIFEVELLEIVN